MKLDAALPLVLRWIWIGALLLVAAPSAGQPVNEDEYFDYSEPWPEKKPDQRPNPAPPGGPRRNADPAPGAASPAQAASEAAPAAPASREPTPPQTGRDPERAQPAVSEPADADADADADAPWRLNGFLREQLHATRFMDASDRRRDGFASATRLRLDGAWTGSNWSARLAGDGDFIFSNYQDDPFFDRLWRVRPRNQALSLESEKNRAAWLGRAGVYRASLAYKSETFEALAGRTDLRWSEGRLLNPLDLVTPLDPWLADAEDLPGADLASGLYRFGDKQSLQAVVQPLVQNDDRDLERMNSRNLNFLTRYSGEWGPLLVNAVGGQHYRSAVIGAELRYKIGAGALHTALLGRREDMAHFDGPRSRRDGVQSTLGGSYAFFGGRLGASLEFLYNSAHTNGDPETELRLRQNRDVAAGLAETDARDETFFLSAGRIFTRNPWLVQAAARFEFTDSLSTEAVALGDPRGKSVIFGPRLTWRFRERSEWTAGARIHGYGRNENRREFSPDASEIFTYVRVAF